MKPKTGRHEAALPTAAGADLPLDERLIGALQEDGRMTNMALARRFGVSEALVRQRLKRLFESKEIRACAIADARTMGLNIVALVRIAAASGEIGPIQAKLKALRAVNTVFLTTGAYNIHSWVIAEDAQALSSLLDEHFRSDPAVRKLDVRFVVEAYRFEGLSGFIVDED